MIEKQKGISLSDIVQQYATKNTAYNKLIIEINLDLENTDNNFVQAQYKILSSTNAANSFYRGTTPLKITDVYYLGDAIVFGPDSAACLRLLSFI